MKRFVVVLAIAAAVVVASLHYVRANPPPGWRLGTHATAVVVASPVLPAVYFTEVPVSMRYDKRVVGPGRTPAESPPQYVQPAINNLRENAANMSGRTATWAPWMNPYTNRRSASSAPGSRKTDGAYALYFARPRSGPMIA